VFTASRVINPKVLNSEEYPVYNHKERPGLGRDHWGNISYNCFTIALDLDQDGYYLPYTFSDFIQRYNRYEPLSGTCFECIAQHKILTFPVGEIEVDRSAVEAKFNYGEANESSYYYCPLIREFLVASTVTAEFVQETPEMPAQPIQAILSGNWDDSYLFELQEIAAPLRLEVCSIIREVASDKFVSTTAERCFWKMWLMSAFKQLEIVRQSPQKIHWEDADFDLSTSKAFSFLFLVPQVWLYVIPKPPPGVDWQAWEQKHREENLPQRVDFLFTYEGKRHIVELVTTSAITESDPGIHGSLQKFSIGRHCQIHDGCDIVVSRSIVSRMRKCLSCTTPGNQT
jgi:hypothetical protein